MTEQDVRLRFMRLIEDNGGTFKAAAKKLGYSPTLLSLCASGKRPIPAPLLMGLGVRREIHYVEVKC